MKAVKKSIAVCLSFLMALNYSVISVDAYTYYTCEYMEEAVEELSQTATDYLEENKDDIEEVVRSCKDELGIKSSGDFIVLGTPFFVYDLDVTTQSEVYYYPLYWKGDSDNIIAVLSLMNTTAGWQYSIDTNWVDELNNIDYEGDQYVFYGDDDGIVAQSEEKKKLIQGTSIKDDFDDRDVETKRKIIVTQFQNSRKIDVEENRKKSETTALTYTPTVTNELGYYYCNITGATGQGNYGLCWAASCATVINYVKGTSYTAKNIADKMGIGYDDGAYLSDIVKAVNTYGLSEYSALYSVPSFSSIKGYIQHKKPIIVTGYTSDNSEGHAVTLYGYRDLTDADYVMFWNSALNSNNGGVAVTTYKGSSTTYVVGSSTYTWSNSVVGSYSTSYK